MFEDVFDVSRIASQAEIMEFLRLWGILFVIVFTLRILQRIRNRVRRARQKRLAKRRQRRFPKNRTTGKS